MLTFTKVQSQKQEVRLPASAILPDTSNGHSAHISDQCRIRNHVPSSPYTPPTHQHSSAFTKEQHSNFQNIRHVSQHYRTPSSESQALRFSHFTNDVQQPHSQGLGSVTNPQTGNNPHRHKAKRISASHYIRNSQLQINRFIEEQRNNFSKAQLSDLHRINHANTQRSHSPSTPECSPSFSDTTRQLKTIDSKL